jgi:hypothetical protein
MKGLPGVDGEKATYTDADLLNMPAIANRFGVALSTVHKWRYRESAKFPAPDIDLPGNRPQPMWYWKTIRKWAVKHRPNYL